MDQKSSFMSNEKKIRKKEGIQIIKSPVFDHRATGCAERNIGSLENSILTYAQEKHPEPLEKMIERALANTVLRNLTKKNTPSKI